MSRPSYIGVGVVAVANMPNSLRPGYPSPAANDLLLLVINHRNSSTAAAATITVPGDWTLLYSDKQSNCRQLIYYKFAAGTESTSTISVTCTTGGTVLWRAFILNFRNVSSSSFVVTAAVTGATSTTISGVSLTTSMTDCLGISLITHDGTPINTLAGLSGATGGTWLQAYEYHAYLPAFELLDVSLDTTTISGGSETVTSSGVWINRGLILKSDSSSSSTTYTESVSLAAVVMKALSASISAEAVVSKSRTVSAIIGPATLKSRTVFANIDVALCAVYNVNVLINSVVSDSKSSNVDIDSIVSKVNTAYSSLDFAALKTLSSLVTMSSAVKTARSTLIYANSCIMKSFSNDVYFSALVGGEISETVDIDSAVMKTIEIAIDVNSVVLKQMTNSTDIDSVVCAQQSFSINFNSFLGRPGSEIISINSVILKEIIARAKFNAYCILSTSTKIETSRLISDVIEDRSISQDTEIRTITGSTEIRSIS